MFWTAPLACARHSLVKYVIAPDRSRLRRVFCISDIFIYGEKAKSSLTGLKEEDRAS